MIRMPLLSALRSYNTPAKLAVLAAVAVGSFVTTAAHATGPHHKPAPDLVIRSVDLHATGACNFLQPAIVGDVTIANRGNATAKALFVSPLIRVYDDANERFSDAEIKINALEPGEAVTARIRLGTLERKRGYEGTRLIRIQADPRNRIDESRERNNTYAVRVSGACGIHRSANAH